MKILTTKEISQSNTIEDINRHYNNDKWVRVDDVMNRLKETKKVADFFVDSDVSILLEILIDELSQSSKGDD